MDPNWLEKQDDQVLDELPEALCRQALRQIREILMDASLEDAACFYKIEEIVCTLEEIGIACGGRHDF